MKIIRYMLVFIFPAIATAGHWSPYAGKFKCADIHNSHECALHIERKLNLPFVTRAGNEVTVSLKSGEEHLFKKEGTLFVVLEHVPKNNVLVMYQQYVEGGTFGLLNLNNGEYREFDGYPLYSPNNKYLVVANYDLEAGYSPNALEIFNSDSFSLMHESDASEWGPVLVEWVNEETLKYVRGTIECLHQDGVTCNESTLKKSKDNWVE